MRSLLWFAVLMVWVSCGNRPGKCDACGPQTLCDTQTGQCIPRPVMMAECVPACAAAKPHCDATSSPANPHCVECLSSSHCSGGKVCVGQRCVTGGAGGGGGAAAGGGGSGSAGGTAGAGGAGGEGASGGGSAGAAGNGGASGDAGSVVDAGTYTGVGSCAPNDGGTIPSICSPNCPEGFVCAGGNCVLNGGNGPVQVTLRWNTIEDLDLRVLEPLTSGGTCEIDFKEPNSSLSPSPCGAVGSLDLDSEAGCSTDHVDIENIIYPASAMAPRGTYTVYVDHYANCASGIAWVPFEVEARFNGNTLGVCGVFRPADADWNNGNATSGRQVLQFTVP